jgi:transposase InsO family protein
MDDGEKQSLEQIRAWVEASEEVRFQSQDRGKLYEWVNRTLRQQDYGRLKRGGKGLVRRYIAKMTGLSRAQAARLIRCYQGGGEVKPRAYQRHRFANRYTPADVEVLAAVDEAHETLSGPATQKILQRAWHEFHDARCERLARLSVAQLYRLRKSGTYRHRRVAYQPTRPTQVAIGERRKPDPQGRSGYLRVDTVHQGDMDGVKGLYHINAVDEVTQWQVVGATAQISEAWLMPVLAAMLAQFPFIIRGFHSDNGSEFINHTVAEMLNKLLVEQTKSRPRHSNDNGLVETKNGWVIRKHIATRPVIFDRELSRCTTPGRLRIAFRQLRSHRVGACGGFRSVLPVALQSVPKFSPAVWGAGNDHQRQGETKAGLPLVCDAVGDLAAVARLGRIPARGDDRGSIAANRRGEIRHPGRPGNARSEAQVIRPFPAQEERVNETGEDRGKPNPGFPSFPTALGNRCAIPTFPPPRRGVEKWKTKDTFPTFPLVVLLTKSTKKGNPCGGSLHSPPSGSSLNEKML